MNPDSRTYRLVRTPDTNRFTKGSDMHTLTEPNKTVKPTKAGGFVFVTVPIPVLDSPPMFIGWYVPLPAVGSCSAAARIV